MSGPTLVTVEAYGVRDLADDARARVLERERADAWDTWVHDGVSLMLHDLATTRIAGCEGVSVDAWSVLNGGPGSMVVAGTIVDPDAFAIAVGVPGHDVGLGLTLDPREARSSRWSGTTYVIRHDRDGAHVDDILSEALGQLVGDILDEVTVWAEAAEADDSLMDGLDEAGYRFDRIGRHLDAVIVDPPTRISDDVLDTWDADGLGGWIAGATWSMILDLITRASWTAADRHDDPVAAADRLRTLGRMLDHAATAVREDELMSGRGVSA